VLDRFESSHFATGGAASFYRVLHTGRVEGFVEEGSDVREGQQLYQIDPSVYQAALDRAQGTLAQQQAALVSAEAQNHRYETLSRINAVSHQDYDDALATERETAASIANTPTVTIPLSIPTTSPERPLPITWLAAS